MATNLHEYISALGAIFTNGISQLAGRLLYIGTLLLATAGLVRQLRRQSGIGEYFLGLYLAVILFWPASQGVRFLIPIIPLYFGYMLGGADWLTERWKRPGLSISMVLCVAVALTYGFAYRSKAWGLMRDGITEREFASVISYIRDNTGADDRFLFRKPRAFALLSGRATAGYNDRKHEGLSGEEL